MPFTVSHVAAVLPAHRWLSRWHVFSAAVIGSMVPDFGVMMRGAYYDRWRTHSLPGLFEFCLPVGLLTYALVLFLIKPALVEILADGPYARLRASDAATPPPDGWRWCLIMLALLGGAITHLIWDGFTHENAPGVRMFPMLEELGPEIDGHPLHVWRWLQYGSSLAGLVVVVAALIIWLRHAPAPPSLPSRRLQSRERRFWVCLYLAFPLMYLAITVWQLCRSASMSLGSGAVLGTVLYAAMRATTLSLLAVSLLLRFRLRRDPQTQRRIDRT
jgi:hypothetical protein